MLQVLSEHQPYEDIRSDIPLMNAIVEGERPTEPEDAARLGFTEELWQAVTLCWEPKREDRPTVDDLLSLLHDALGFWYIRGL
jgi:hypothetical protein